MTSTETTDFGFGALVSTVTDHYLLAGLWCDAHDEDGELIEDAHITYSPPDVDNREDAEETVGSFLGLAGQYAMTLAYVQAHPDQAGHDLWLSANRHGAGFFDRGLGTLGDRLHTMAESVGGAMILVTEDGPEYITN